MDQMEHSEDEIFEISAVARLTGVSTHLLRVWERRYEAVIPQRNESGRRHYTREDIRRLTLLKSLVDLGHAIGSIAALETGQLEDRLASALQVEGEPAPQPEVYGPGSCRVALVGTQIRSDFLDAVDRMPALRITDEFRDLDEVAQSLRPGAAELLVLETETLFPEDIEAIQKRLHELELRRAIVVYHFAHDEAMSTIDLQRVTALTAPVGSSEFQLACHADVRMAENQNRVAPADREEQNGPPARAEGSGEIPPRRFSDQDLMKLGDMTSAVQCECPQHLARLLSSLAAFETYSRRCESRHDDDAKLHAYLHRTTANCRSEMESALAEVLRQEGITL